MKRILLLCICLQPLPAVALPVIDFSISVGLNHSRLDSVANDWDTNVSSTFSGTEPRASVNFSVTSLFGFELGWSKLASASGTVTPLTACPGGCPPGTPTPSFTFSESGTALWLAYAPSLEFGALELGGKLGAARLQHEFALDGNPLDVDDTEVLYGATGTYWFRDTMGLRLDIERIGSDVTQAGVSLTIGL